MPKIAVINLSQSTNLFSVVKNYGPSFYAKQIQNIKAALKILKGYNVWHTRYRNVVILILNVI